MGDSAHKILIANYFREKLSQVDGLELASSFRVDSIPTISSKLGQLLYSGRSNSSSSSSSGSASSSGYNGSGGTEEWHHSPTGGLLTAGSHLVLLHTFGRSDIYSSPVSFRADISVVYMFFMA